MIRHRASTPVSPASYRARIGAKTNAYPYPYPEEVFVVVGGRLYDEAFGGAAIRPG